MRVEIDQSGKIEETNKDTILALSNNIEYSICLPSSVKKQALEILRRKKQGDKVIFLKIFAFGLFLLLEPYLNDLSAVFIDNEYPGNEASIKSILLEFIKRTTGRYPSFTIDFILVKKNSLAHHVAWGASTKFNQRKVNKVVKAKEILRLVK